MSSWINTALFGVYPYVCLTVLLLGSLVRSTTVPTLGRAIPRNCSGVAGSVSDRTFSTMVCSL